MYFTSPSREEGILTSPYMVTTSGGCLYFYYNMEGGPSVELKIYIQAGVNKTMTFYANGIDMKTDQWKKGWFNIPPGGTEVFFHAYGDIYYLKPSIVAIDDIFFDEGTRCPASPSKYEDNSVLLFMSNIINVVQAVIHTSAFCKEQFV
jgi:hypothetical protein